MHFCSKAEHSRRPEIEMASVDFVREEFTKTMSPAGHTEFTGVPIYADCIYPPESVNGGSKSPIFSSYAGHVLPNS
ncbi:hypothetical protein [Planctomicrobium piriforme]|uniref:Uncharacterized protein n=1 Tax=Planctomicrobium piriforme TaxID=1576369 RepID=A0A1I3DJB7_9PLAN|nr:hypothetical protein [Planctomicrobium piriforme]SFH86830.1 hypothetical protein SAMN05421753_103272 [Planctomicrobium piriforme]